MSKVILIGLTGKKGAGKDTAARYLKTAWCDKRGLHNVGVEHRVMFLGFADPLREIGKIFGFSMSQMHDPACKEIDHEVWGWSWRRFAQYVGTDMFRNMFRKDCWIRLMEMRLTHELANRHEGLLVVTDVRFPNEADLVRKLGGVVVEVRRPQRTVKPGAIRRLCTLMGIHWDTSAHSSERGVPEDTLDYTILNDGTIDTLQYRTTIVLQNIEDDKNEES